jgi:hypothetical protein
VVKIGGLKRSKAEYSASRITFKSLCADFYSAADGNWVNALVSGMNFQVDSGHGLQGK